MHTPPHLLLNLICVCATHASAGRAHSTAMRAMLGCMDRDDDAHGKRTVECDWRKRGWGLGETQKQGKQQGKQPTSEACVGTATVPSLRP